VSFPPSVPEGGTHLRAVAGVPIRTRGLALWYSRHIVLVAIPVVSIFSVIAVAPLEKEDVALPPSPPPRIE